MKTADQNIIIEPSKSNPDAWYWRVITDEGETYAEGDGEDSYDWATWKAIANLNEYREQQGRAVDA